MMTMNKPNRLSYIEEDIQVKPSTELIADEYEHFSGSGNQILVHAFASSDESDGRNVEMFAKSLKKCGIEIEAENRHNLETDNCVEVLINICLQWKNSNGLIILFSGPTQEEGHLDIFDGTSTRSKNIQEIWSMFDSYHCEASKNKPKIFIFEINNFSHVQADSSRLYTTTYELTYETPAEADILIVYNKTDADNESEFMELMCENIDEYGKDEDIISLVTCIASRSCRPMIISTLTRKFYFTASEMRGHHSVIDKNQKELVGHLKKVSETLDAKVSEKKGKRSFLSFIGRKSKEKNGEKEKAEQQQPEPEVKSVVNEPGPSSAPRPSLNTGRRISLPPARNRTLSTTESDSGKSKEKPRWKY
ncbi:hypothetical protein JTB14_036848 [Gonioctena quinquepunctata]|nr:hypothetical protein JTB14_036848 [Gonioctena quinquepunctata]